MGFQFDKDLVSQGPFSIGVAGCLILREQVFDPLVIGFLTWQWHQRGVRGRSDVMAWNALLTHGYGKQQVPRWYRQSVLVVQALCHVWGRHIPPCLLGH